MKERGNYEIIRKASRLYIKEIRVIEGVEHDHFNRDQGDRARLA
jgi:hypothetical protein